MGCVVQVGNGIELKAVGLQVAPLWCDLGFVPNSRGNKAVANLRPMQPYLSDPIPPRYFDSLVQINQSSQYDCDLFTILPDKAQHHLVFNAALADSDRGVS